MSRKSNITVLITRNTMANGEPVTKGQKVSLRAADARLLIKMRKAVDPNKGHTAEPEPEPEFVGVEEMQERLDALEDELDKAQASKAKDAPKRVAKIEAEIEQLEEAIANS